MSERLENTAVRDFDDDRLAVERAVVRGAVEQPTVPDHYADEGCKNPPGFPLVLPDVGGDEQSAQIEQVVVNCRKHKPHHIARIVVDVRIRRYPKGHGIHKSRKHGDKCAKLVQLFHSERDEDRKYKITQRGKFKWNTQMFALRLVNRIFDYLLDEEIKRNNVCDKIRDFRIVVQQEHKDVKPYKDEEDYEPEPPVSVVAKHCFISSFASAFSRI